MLLNFRSDSGSLGGISQSYFIIVIASLVQFVEMVIKKISQPLYRALGKFLPLLTTKLCYVGLCIMLSA
jgi:electron transport complex protein RnfA